MKTLPRLEAGIVWGELWNDLKNEWFKVEVLQDYSAEDKSESLDAWMAGDKERSIELIKAEPSEWANDCRKKVEDGVKLTRIHVVDYPLSEYVQWEIEVYKNRNIPVGREDVYLLDRKDIPMLDLPSGDLMIFDKTNVVVGNYDSSGYVVSQDFYTGNDTISEFLELREQLLGAKLQRV